MCINSIKQTFQVFLFWSGPNPYYYLVVLEPLLLGSLQLPRLFLVSLWVRAVASFRCRSKYFFATGRETPFFFAYFP